MALRVHGEALGVETGVDTRGDLGGLAGGRAALGFAVPPNKAIVGGNAFRHASGIHQDGVLKRRETYETIDPAEIGHPVGTRDRARQALGPRGLRRARRALGLARPKRRSSARSPASSASPTRGEVCDDELRLLTASPQAARPRRAQRAERA